MTELVEPGGEREGGESKAAAATEVCQKNILSCILYVFVISSIYINIYIYIGSYHGKNTFPWSACRFSVLLVLQYYDCSSPLSMSPW